jgi:hypothetical protein
MAKNNGGTPVKNQGEKTVIEKAGEDLFNYAIDREEIKWHMARLHESADINRNTVEYELQILKIISVGWSLSFYLEGNPTAKEQLQDVYWKAINEFAGSLSETTALMIGKDIQYFEVLRERLDTYVAAMEKQPDAKEPASVIGPEFARSCGNEEDIFTAMTGSKLFFTAVSGVKEYLEKIHLR